MLLLMFRPMFLFVMLILSACQPLEAAPPPTNPQKSASERDRARESPVDVAKAKLDAPANQAQEQPGRNAPVGAIVPHASVEQVDAGQEALAEAIVAASKPGLTECRANSGGGKLRLRVVGSKSSAKITIDPGSNIDAGTRDCVLQALSTLDVPDTLSQASPSMRPSTGFTSIIAVNW